MSRKKKEAVNKSGNVDDLANCVMINPTLVSQLEALGFKSKNPGGGMTFKEAMICSQIANAVRGDIDAYRAVMDYAGCDKKTPLEKFINDVETGFLEVLQ